MNDSCAACGADFREGDRFCAKCGAPRPDAGTPVEPATESQASSKRWSTVLGVAVAIVSLGVAVVGIRGCTERVEGHVTVEGGPHGGFTFTPTGCASMQPYGRFGANIHAQGPNDGGVYVTVDPTHGKAVEIEIPGSCKSSDGTDCTVFLVPRDRCTVYDAKVEGTGTVVNDVRLVEGSLKLDCKLVDGTIVRGEIEFGGC